MILEAKGLSLLVVFHTHRHVADGDIAVAPIEQHHRIDKQCQQEIHQHTTDHNQQSLPCRFCTELPGLLRLFHLFRVETLVDHSGNLTIATQWQPSDTILRVTVLGLELKDASIPFTNAKIKEHIEFVYAYSEELGEEEMSSFMK